MKKLKTFISVIIVIFMTVLLCELTAILVLRKQLTKEAINDLVMKSDAKAVTKILEQNSNPIIVQTEKILKEVGFPEDTVSDLLNSKGTKNFISVYATNCVNYLLDFEENDEAISTDLLKELVDTNIDVLSSKLKGEEKEKFDEYSGEFYQYVDKHRNELVNYFPTAEDILNQVKQDKVFVYKNITLKQVIEVMDIINKPKLLNTIIFSLTILSLLLIILNSFKWLKHFSITLSIYSSLLLLIELIILIANKLKLFNVFKAMESFASILFNNIARDLWIYIVISLVVDVIFIIVYKIIKKYVLVKKPSE